MVVYGVSLAGRRWYMYMACRWCADGGPTLYAGQGVT